MERIDKRGLLDLRTININMGWSVWAEGSCLIEWGNTKVICTASLDKNVPSFLKGKNQGWITAEYSMIPRATQMRNLRDRTYTRHMEIQRLIGRSLRAVVDLKELGERTIWIDCDVLQADGGTRIASIVGGFMALSECLIKLYKEGTISKIPIKELLGAVSVGIYKSEYILDLNFQEDSEADVDMNVVMTSKGRFIEIQGCGEKNTFSLQELNSLLNIASCGINKVIDIEKEVLKNLIDIDNLCA